MSLKSHVVYEDGKEVMAKYPSSTFYYRAQVHGYDEHNDEYHIKFKRGRKIYYIPSSELPEQCIQATARITRSNSNTLAPYPLYTMSDQVDLISKQVPAVVPVNHRADKAYHPILSAIDATNIKDDHEATYLDIEQTTKLLNSNNNNHSHIKSSTFGVDGKSSNNDRSSALDSNTRTTSHVQNNYVERSLPQQHKSIETPSSSSVIVNNTFEHVISPNRRFQANYIDILQHNLHSTSNVNHSAASILERPLPRPRQQESKTTLQYYNCQQHMYEYKENFICESNSGKIVNERYQTGQIPSRTFKSRFTTALRTFIQILLVPFIISMSMIMCARKCFTVKNINYELSNMSSELNTTMLMFTTGHSVLITLVNSWAYQQVITYNWLPLLVHYMTPFCIVSVLTTYFVSLIASFTQKQENSKPLFILSLTSEEIHYRFKLNPSLALSLFLSLLFSLENIFNPINLMPNKIASLSFENLFKSYPFELIRWLHPAMFLFQRYKFPPQLRNFICAVILSGE
ncbi:unnamed protein product [Didymodactylos carnosus]|uniref:Lamin-B receptor of TUDOR domain-containing protein n=2 Tax=Didymodactylos carnosus TaxID=1234261 RepID=A0A814JQM1_9BILA|nr:unnamed protein product [Didymodactylos carnosus]CAF3809226.1 unnamed protein product [Didymodactylos carnosus]